MLDPGEIVSRYVTQCFYLEMLPDLSRVDARVGAADFEIYKLVQSRLNSLFIIDLHILMKKGM